MIKSFKKELLINMLSHVRLQKNILEVAEADILNQLQKLKTAYNRQCRECNEAWQASRYATEGCPFCNSHQVLSIAI